MSPLLTIARREFRSYFDSPLAYVVICLSLLLVGFLFFMVADFWKVDRATMAELFEKAPWGLVFVVPVVTMRLLAEERRSGTLEMLITLPVKDSDVILGKYLGALGLVLVLILTTLCYPFAMFVFPWRLGVLDMGPVWTGYLGLTLIGAAAVAIGMLVSSLSTSQAVSAIITFVVMAVLLMVGRATDKLPEWLGNVVQFVSFDARLQNFTRGLIDTRDVIYFLSITVVCLMISFRALERRKWA